METEQDNNEVFIEITNNITQRVGFLIYPKDPAQESDWYGTFETAVRFSSFVEAANSIPKLQHNHKLFARGHLGNYSYRFRYVKDVEESIRIQAAHIAGQRHSAICSFHRLCGRLTEVLKIDFTGQSVGDTDKHFRTSFVWCGQGVNLTLSIEAKEGETALTSIRVDRTFCTGMATHITTPEFVVTDVEKLLPTDIERCIERFQKLAKEAAGEYWKKQSAENAAMLSRVQALT